MMVYRIIGVLSLCWGMRASAQVSIYATYEGWKANKPTATYERFRGFGTTFGVPYITVRNEYGGKEITVRMKDVWGFTDEGVLHRLDTGKGSRFLWLVTEGPVCVWRSKSLSVDQKENVAYDYLLFISHGVDGETVPLPHGLKRPPEARYNAFVREHRAGELAPLVACLEATEFLEPAELCIAQFNKR